MAVSVENLSQNGYGSDHFNKSSNSIHSQHNSGNREHETGSFETKSEHSEKLWTLKANGSDINLGNVKKNKKKSSKTA